jgi:oligoribonuclease
MSQDANNLVWMDMEMSGLDPDRDRILEVAVVVTDARLETLAEAPVMVLHQPEATLEAMDEWNRSTHAKSGLIAKVRESRMTEAEVESRLREFVARYVPERVSPLCGNSICQDRRFLARYMPALEAYFHYRNLDVSVLKELARRWKPEVYKRLEKKGRHEALADIHESIAELRFYRDNLLRV